VGFSIPHSTSSSRTNSGWVGCSPDTVVRDYFRDPVTYFGVRDFENRALNSHGGNESRTTV
jgi:hypothetical protein